MTPIEQNVLLFVELRGQVTGEEIEALADNQFLAELVSVVYDPEVLTNAKKRAEALAGGASAEKRRAYIEAADNFVASGVLALSKSGAFEKTPASSKLSRELHDAICA